ncbi:MAG: N-acetylmuramoyl-L-alanine amidase [Gallintestinimicrobium sp.]
MAYAVIGENDHSISIECCYLDQDGKFTDATYQSLLKLLGWLMEEYNLDVSDVKRHYDAGGKLCPLYYAEHEDAWEQLKQDLSDYISGKKSKKGFL